MAEGANEVDATNAAWAVRAVCLLFHGVSTSTWEDAPGRTAQQALKLLEVAQVASRSSLIEDIQSWVSKDLDDGIQPPIPARVRAFRDQYRQVFA